MGDTFDGMEGNRRPLAVTIIACLYIAVGAVGFVAHFGSLHTGRLDGVEMEIVAIVAIVSGLFLWRGQNRARWLVMAWMAFHVALSVPDWGKVAVHSLFLAVLSWFLSRRRRDGIFVSRRVDETDLAGSMLV